MFSNVLIPTDGSDGAREAAAVAFELARQFDATVHGLFVIDERVIDGEFDFAVEAAEETAENALDALGELGDDYGIDVRKHLRRGTPYDEIVRAIDAYEVDHVVMGTHGRTGFDRIVNLGSVTERVVRTASVPVTTVPIGSR